MRGSLFVGSSGRGIRRRRNAGLRWTSQDIVDDLADLWAAGPHRELHEPEVFVRAKNAGEREAVTEELHEDPPAVRSPEDVVRLGEVQTRGDLRRGGHGRVAIAVVVIDAGPRKVETIGRPLWSPTTRARTLPISSARDSRTRTSASSEERRVASVGTPITWVSISLSAICSYRIVETGFSSRQIK